MSEYGLFAVIFPHVIKKVTKLSFSLDGSKIALSRWEKRVNSNHLNCN